MGMTSDQLERAVWGSGYGGKKHLVDRRRSQLRAVGAVGYYDDIRARCSPSIALAVVDTWDPAGSSYGESLLEELSRRQPCTRCAELAERGIAERTPIYREPMARSRPAA